MGQLQEQAKVKGDVAMIGRVIQVDVRIKKGEDMKF
jgi:hypothetical protein